MENRPLEYDYTVAKLFMYNAIFVGVVGMLVGVILAWQMAFPGLNTFLGVNLAEYTSFSRLRPLHTDSVIYGFVLSAIWSSWYYIGQRVLKVSMAESIASLRNASPAFSSPSSNAKAASDSNAMNSTIMLPIR